MSFTEPLAIFRTLTDDRNDISLRDPVSEYATVRKSLEYDYIEDDGGIQKQTRFYFRNVDLYNAVAIRVWFSKRPDSIKAELHGARHSLVSGTLPNEYWLRLQTKPRGPSSRDFTIQVITKGWTTDSSALKVDLLEWGVY